MVYNWTFGCIYPIENYGTYGRFLLFKKWNGHRDTGIVKTAQAKHLVWHVENPQWDIVTWWSVMNFNKMWTFLLLWFLSSIKFKNLYTRLICHTEKLTGPSPMGIWAFPNLWKWVSNSLFQHIGMSRSAVNMCFESTVTNTELQHL